MWTRPNLHTGIGSGRSPSRRLRVWLALLSVGLNFYDTFVLTSPSGEKPGGFGSKYRLARSLLFRGEEGSHVISTAIGKIGVLNRRLLLLCGLAVLKGISRFRHNAALLADMSNGGGLPSPPGTHLASETPGNLVLLAQQ
jgi:hypothetical protein